MSAKITFDDLFEKEQQQQEALQERLASWEQRLQIVLGMGTMWLLLAPEFARSGYPATYAPFLLIGLLFGPPLVDLYLLLRPTWRTVPLSARSEAITLAFLAGIVTFASLSFLAFAHQVNPVGFIMLLGSGAAGYGMHRLNERWKRPAATLFP